MNELIDYSNGKFEEFKMAANLLMFKYFDCYCLIIFISTRYLVRENKIPDHWYPKDSRARAQVDEFLEWQHHNVRATCSLYFQAKWVKPLVTGQQEAPGKLEKLKANMEKSLDLMENIWLNHDHKFMINDQLTIADLLGACEVEQPTMAGYDPLVGRPRLAKWMANVKAATNPVYDEAHKFVYKFAAAKL
jgi:glutathione S-transferase